MRRWLPLIVLGLVIAAFLASQRGGSGDRAGNADSPACVSVPRTTLDAIEEGLTISGGGSLTRGGALRSGDWWYVAAEIDGGGLEGAGDVGVWAMPDYRDPGPIIMADGFAREFSQWGTQTGAENLGVWMGAALDAQDCVD